MDHKNVSALIRECLAIDRSAHEARERADGLLCSFLEAAKADVAAAITAYNAEGRGTYIYGEHATKTSIAWDNGSQTVCVVIDLGNFTQRETGRTLTPREAWNLDEDRLV